MKLNAPQLSRFRSIFSYDGQFTQFTIVNKAGANLSFTVPFWQLGTLIESFQKVARNMAERLSKDALANSAQVLEGLANAPAATALAMARDGDTGEALIWFESDAGGMSIRLSPEMLGDLRAALDQHENEGRDRLAAE